MAQLISIVVPVYNGERIVAGCIESLLAVSHARDDVEIIVVDDGSSDRTREVVARYPVTCLPQPKRGAAAARNLGIRRARGDRVAFTDADCVVRPDWLREMVKGFTDETVACVGGAILTPPPATDLEWYAHRFNPISQENAITDRVVLFPHVITANAMFRKDIFDRVGYFDERFPAAGGEDLDLGWRIHWAGFTMRYVPAAQVEHRHKSRLRQLFKQHYRYGYAWTVIVRKHREMFRNAGPSFWGVYPADIRALRAAVSGWACAAWSAGLTRETKFRFYGIVRQMGEYSGKFVAAVTR
ncbi:MAG: glycosyltransferase [Chlamydiota bacterium]